MQSYIVFWEQQACGSSYKKWPSSFVCNLGTSYCMLIFKPKQGQMYISVSYVLFTCQMQEIFALLYGLDL